MKSLSEQLNSDIDQYEGNFRTQGQVSFDLPALAAYLLVSEDVAQKLSAMGLIKSRGPVHRNGTNGNGRQIYVVSELNELRRAVLVEVVSEVIASADSEGEIGIAAGHALRQHVKQFSAQPKTTELASRTEDEEPSRLRKAAVLAGTAGAAYSGASWLRGRAPGRTPLQAVAAGHAATSANARTIVNDRLRPAAGRALGTISDGARKAGDALLRARTRR